MVRQSDRRTCLHHHAKYRSALGRCDHASASLEDAGGRKKYTGLIDSLSRRLQSQDYTWRLLRPDASDVERTAYTRLDAAVLDYFRERPAPPASAQNSAYADSREFREFRTEDNPEYHYYQPIRAKKECLICHENGRKATGAVASAADPATVLSRVSENDLMSVVKVVMPDSETQKSINSNRAILLSTAIITVFLAMLAAYAIVRYVIVKPLEHLREVSDEVRRGNVDARADIHTADEFEELGVAFNRMLRGLVDSQDARAK